MLLFKINPKISAQDTRISSGVKVLGTCHFEKKIGAFFPYMKKGTHNSVFLARKVQSHKRKRLNAVYKDARFITLFQVHTYDDSKFLLVSICIPITPWTFPLCLKRNTHNTVFPKKVPLKNGTPLLPFWCRKACTVGLIKK